MIVTASTAWRGPSRRSRRRPTVPRRGPAPSWTYRWTGRTRPRLSARPPGTTSSTGTGKIIRRPWAARPAPRPPSRPPRRARAGNGRAPGHHGGDGPGGCAGDDDADPEAALQRTPLARGRRPPRVPAPAALARPARVPGRTLPRSATRARSLPRPGRLSLPGLGGHPPGKEVRHPRGRSPPPGPPGPPAPRPPGPRPSRPGSRPRGPESPRIGHATASLTPGRPGARCGRSRRSAAPSRGNGPAAPPGGTVPPRPPGAAPARGGTAPPRPPGAAGGGPGTRPRGLAPGSPPYGLLGRVSRRGGSLICASDVSRCGLITGT